MIFLSLQEILSFISFISDAKHHGSSMALFQMS